MIVDYRFQFNRKNKLNKDGKGVIELVCYKNRIRKFISTKIWIFPNEWNDKIKSGSIKYIKNKNEDNERLNIQLTAINDKYKEFELNPRHGDAALIELYRRGAFSGAQLTRAISQWDKPAHVEHTQFDAGAGTWSLWRLFNACTEALKPTGNVNNSVLVAQRSELISTFMNEITTSKAA